jgi:16S rRNA (guanine1207-N2)-methyltransferase
MVAEHALPITPPPRAQERLLLELISELPSGRMLCNTAGRGQFATEFARHKRDSQVACWFLDLYQMQESQSDVMSPTPNLQFTCSADPPLDECNQVSWAFSRQGDSELTREMLQLGHQRLALSGQMIATIDNLRDHWLHEQLQKLFDKVTRRLTKDGAIYQVTKHAALRKIKNYAAEFAFRDGERLIHLRTRPGVFSHRRLDGGARSLIKAMWIEPGMRVLDLGCGSGAVSIAAALRAPDTHVSAIDSNPRAIESTLWAAERNGVTVSTALDCEGSTVERGAYDLVLGNPPYYSSFRLARLFIEIAMKAIHCRGKLLVVTKTPQWYADHLPHEFNEVMTEPVGNYTVVIARRA